MSDKEKEFIDRMRQLLMIHSLMKAAPDDNPDSTIFAYYADGSVQPIIKTEEPVGIRIDGVIYPGPEIRSLFEKVQACESKEEGDQILLEFMKKVGR